MLMSSQFDALATAKREGVTDGGKYPSLNSVKTGSHLYIDRAQAVRRVRRSVAAPTAWTRALDVN